MADNFIANAGAGGDTFAADEISAVKYPRSKITIGADGANDGDVSAANPLPVTGPLTDTQLRATPVPVSGTVATGGLTDAQLRASAVPIAIDSTISTVNSSTATLGIGAVFTGTAEDISNYAAVRISVFADQASAANGLSIQQSSNGTNWDFADAYTVSASTQCLIGVPPYAKFIRVVYTNGAVANTVFRLQTVFHRTNTKPSSMRPGDAMSLQNDFEANLALLSFSNGTTADLARGDTTNGLDVDVTRLPSIPAGANVIGSLTANQSINLVQLNGITVALGSGGVSTGTLRVVQSSDTVPGTLQDNAAFTDGTTRIYMQGFIFDEVAGTALTENDAAAPRIDSKRAVVNTLEDATTRGQRLAISAGGAAEVQGEVAHDAAISGNPVRLAGRGITADYTAVATGDTADLITTVLGKQVVVLGAIPDNTWSYAAAAGGLVTTTGVTVKAAGAAGVRNYVKSIQVINSHQTTSTEIVVRDGAAGTVIHRGWAQAAGGGYTATFDPPLRGSTATLVEIAEVTTTGTAGVLVSLQGYFGAE